MSARLGEESLKLGAAEGISEVVVSGRDELDVKGKVELGLQRQPTLEERT